MRSKVFFERELAPWFLALGGILVMTCLTVYRGLSEHQRFAERNQRSQSLLNGMAQVIEALERAEVAARARDPRELDRAGAVVSQKVEELRGTSKGESEVLGRLAELGQGAALVLGRLDASVRRPEAAGGEGLTQARELIDRTVRIERELQEELEREAEADERLSREVLTLLSVLMTLGLILGSILLVRASRARRLAEAVVRQSERRFRGAFDAAAVGMAMVALDGRFLRVNRALTDIVGLTEDELGKRRLQDLAQADEADEAQAAMDRLVAEHLPSLHGDRCWVHAEGRLLWVRLSLSLVHDDSGAPAHFVAMIEDITPRKNAEQALREQSDLLRSILDQLADGVVVVDRDDRFILFNRAAEAILGSGPLDAHEERWADLYGCYQPDGVGPFDTNDFPLVRAIGGQASDGVEMLIRTNARPQGVALEVGARPLLDDAGAIRGAVAVFRDISQRKQVEAAAKRERHLLSESIANAPIAIAMLDDQLRYLAHSAKWLADHNVGPGPLIGRAHEEVFPDLPEHWKRAYRQALEGEVVSESEDVLEHADGRREYLRWAIHPWHSPEGKVGGIIIVTDRIDDLVHARQAALASARTKADFLANMSHEIRTPMNGIVGMTHLLLDTTLDDYQRDCATTIRGCAEALLSIINDILDVSKMEAGKMCLVIDDFDLRTLLEEVAQLLAPMAHRKGLRIFSHMANGLPDWFRGDAGRIRQIMTNLAGNAVKFTEAGEVVIHAEALHDSDSTVTLRLSVRDTGIGIPIDYQDAVFESFTQLDNGPRPTGGTGLGLTICKRLVDVMGGRIGLTSQPGQGSTFWVELTLPRAEKECSCVPVALEGRRALMVNMHQSHREVLRETLRAWGCSVEEVATAAEARARLTPNARGPFDLVLLEQGSADADAIAQEGPIAYGDARLIMLAAPGDVGPPTPKGPFAAIVATPVRRSALFNAVTRALLPQTEPAPEHGLATCRPRGEETRSPLGLRVLVAEDNDVNRRVVRRMLSAWGCEVQTVDDGKQALEALADHNFDIVFMDLQMPVMDGLEATRLLRLEEAQAGDGRHQRIVALTAHALDEDRRRCIAEGFDGYLRKPFRPFELREALLRHAQGPKAEPVPRPIATPEATFQAEVLRDLCEGDIQGEREIIEAVRKEVPVLIARMEKALADQDPEAVRRSAHALKGDCLTVGATALGEASRSMEARGKAGDLSNAEGLRGEIQARWEELDAQLASHLESMVRMTRVHGPTVHAPILGKSGTGLPPTSSAVRIKVDVRAGDNVSS